VEEPLKNIDQNNIPKHVAVIMDGNGRWAKKKGAMRIFGHKNAIKSIRETTEGCAELGVKYLTLYAFSTENWSRPKAEVDALMELLVNTIRKEVPTLMKNNVRLQTIGNTKTLPRSCQENLEKATLETRGNKGLTLILALSYSGRWEIVQAVKNIAARVQTGDLEIDSIDIETFDNSLSTASIPDPELMIRTSGEMRISNFLLWQLAYTELYITETLWPDFRKENLYEAILSYQERERRFGKTSEQVNK
jgi:undecaprenyl diphosphate synthase